MTGVQVTGADKAAKRFAQIADRLRRYDETAEPSTDHLRRQRREAPKRTGALAAAGRRYETKDGHTVDIGTLAYGRPVHSGVNIPGRRIAPNRYSFRAARQAEQAARSRRRSRLRRIFGP